MADCWLTGFFQHTAYSQRVYTDYSVLASGNWYRIGVKDAGIYRIDIPFLNTLGVNTANLASSTFRLFGNGGTMLPEDPGTPKTDDLIENPCYDRRWRRWNTQWE